MALDATVGGASANSYLTVADADAYADDDLGRNGRTWMSADLLDKERALIKATWQVDEFVPPAERWSATQALAFPRLVDASNDVPYLLPTVRRAAYYQAAYILANADVLDDASSRRARGLISFTENDVSGAPSLDPSFGRYAPEFIQALGALRVVNTFMSVPIRGPYYRVIP